MNNNQDFMNAINVWAALIGYMNYQENLTQSDKDDMLQSIDKKMVDMLSRLEKDLEEQNVMLREILECLRGESNERREFLQGEDREQT